MFLCFRTCPTGLVVGFCYCFCFFFLLLSFPKNARREFISHVSHIILVLPLSSVLSLSTPKDSGLKAIRNIPWYLRVLFLFPAIKRSKENPTLLLPDFQMRSIRIGPERGLKISTRDTGYRAHPDGQGIKYCKKVPSECWKSQLLFGTDVIPQIPRSFYADPLVDFLNGKAFGEVFV